MSLISFFSPLFNSSQSLAYQTLHAFLSLPSLSLSLRSRPLSHAYAGRALFWRVHS
jgi:hypothetical protein